MGKNSYLIHKNFDYWPPNRISISRHTPPQNTLINYLNARLVTVLTEVIFSPTAEIFWCGTFHFPYVSYAQYYYLFPFPMTNDAVYVLVICIINHDKLARHIEYRRICRKTNLQKYLRIFCYFVSFSFSESFSFLESSLFLVCLHFLTYLGLAKM